MAATIPDLSLIADFNKGPDDGEWADQVKFANRLSLPQLARRRYAAILKYSGSKRVTCSNPRPKALPIRERP